MKHEELVDRNRGLKNIFQLASFSTARIGVGS